MSKPDGKASPAERGLLTRVMGDHMTVEQYRDFLVKTGTKITVYDERKHGPAVKLSKGSVRALQDKAATFGPAMVARVNSMILSGEAESAIKRAIDGMTPEAKSLKTVDDFTAIFGR